MEAHGFGQGHSGDEFSAAALADLGGTDWAGPDGGADLKARVERLAMLNASVNLDGLLWDSPAAALGSPGRGQQSVDDAFQGVSLSPEALGIGWGV